MSILTILNEIAATSKQTEKQAIFAREQGNLLFKEVCRVAYDPNINFYIRQFNLPAANVGSHTLEAGIAYVLENIASRKMTGYTALSYLESVLSWLSSDDAEVLARIIRRDLRIGASDSTINGTWANLITSYPVMLCQPDKPKNRARIRFPAYAQLKSDGLRINAIVLQGGSIEYLSRSGKAVSCNSPDMDAAFKKMVQSFGTDMVFDGELLWLDDNGKIAPREIGNGKASKATRGEMSEADRGRFVFSIWDAIPLAVRDEEARSRPYKERFEALGTAVTKQNFSRIQLIQCDLIGDWEEAENIFAQVLDAGQEGLIIKNIDGIWENDRSDDCVKMKAELEGDFEIIGWKEGNGKYEGMIGSFQMASADRSVQFNCAGIPDDVRASSPEAFVGKIAAVRYNCIMPSKNGAPRRGFLPRMIEIRDDKTVADNF